MASDGHMITLIDMNSFMDRHSSDVGIPCDIGSKNLLLPKKNYWKKNEEENFIFYLQFCLIKFLVTDNKKRLFNKCT